MKKERLITTAKTEGFEIWDDKDNQLFRIHFLRNDITIGLDYEEFEEFKECLKEMKNYSWERK